MSELQLKEKKRDSNWSDEVVTLKRFTYDSYLSPYRGSLSFRHEGCDKEWKYDECWSCRDSFLVYSYKRTHLLFNCEGIENAKKVAILVHRVESHLGLKARTIMGMTSEKNYMWIKTPRWWVYSAIRRSFFTAMLRAGLHYDHKRDIYSNLSSCSYFRDTQEAVRMFLDGHTKLAFKTKYRSRRGWHDVFWYGDMVPKQYYTEEHVISPMLKKVLEKVLLKP